MSEFTEKLISSEPVLNAWDAIDKDQANAGLLIDTISNEFKDWQPPKPLVEVPEITQKQADTLVDYKNGSNSLLEYLRVEVKKKDYNRFALAWLDGYTVEKEQLYEVIINGLYLAKLMNDDDSKSHRFIEKDKLVNWQETGYRLTAKQIKMIDKRYMAFAVKVDEVEP